MSFEKFKETLKDLNNLGLNGGKEEQLIKTSLVKLKDDPKSVEIEDLNQIDKRIKNYKKELFSFQRTMEKEENNLKSCFEKLLVVKDKKNIQKISTRNLDKKYRNYLMHKKELKKKLKELRKKNIDNLMEKGNLEEQCKKKLELEKKFIEIMPFYENLRHGIFSKLMEHVNSNADFLMEKHYFDYKFFRREKPEVDLNQIDRFEFQIKAEQEKRRKMKEKLFMTKVFENNLFFADFHKKKLKFLKKISGSAKFTQESIKKRKIQLIKSKDNKRLEDLKNERMDEYIKKLEETKDRKILQILEETHNFLREIGMKIVLNKGEKGNANLIEMEKTNMKYDISKASLKKENYNKVYYDFTHTNREEIKKQPTILEGGTLKSYQLAGLEWMISLYNNKLNGILADEMGLGKTIQTIALFAYLIEFKQNFGPFLIVVPLSTLTNWKLEFDKWAPSINKVLYKGNKIERKAIARFLKNNKFNICLTTYEYILIDKSELNHFNWQYIVVDEGHKLKNPKSKFAQTLGTQYHSENRILLTGTPLQNNLTELWALFNFLLPNVFGSSDDFDKWFKFTNKKNSNDKEMQLNEEERLLLVNRFHQVLRPFLLRREKKEVEHELPRKVEYIIKVELSAWQKIIYNQITDRESLNLLSNSQKYNRFMMNNVIMQHRKISNHPYIFLDYYTETEELMRCSGKFELLDRMIPKLLKTGHRMLIFTQMTQVIQLLAVFFHYRGIRTLILDGSTKLEVRAERMAAFNKPNSEFPIFILSTRAGGLGLNLQTADTVILFDSDWNPKIDEQAQDRAHRIGTKSEVRVYRFVCLNTIEEDILAKATIKKNLVEALIDSGLYNLKSTDYDRKERLEQIFKKQSLEKDEVDDEIPDDEEINKILARSDEEYEIFQAMDQRRYEEERIFYADTFSLTKNYRLLSYEEVPEYIRELEELKKNPPKLTKRKRPELSRLNDISSDEEFKVKKRRKRTTPVEKIKPIKDGIDHVAKGQDEIFIDSDG